MKICIVGDIHWCSNSSIVRTKGEEFSTRLENCINSINFAEEEAIRNNCDFIIYCGDFFDTPILNAEEITALSSVSWNKNIKRFILVGNHEISSSDDFINSAYILSLLPNTEVVSKVTSRILENNVHLTLLPYILESNRKELKEYLKNIPTSGYHLICSHNDLKGFKMGKFESTIGFTMDEIETNCDIYFNGHLHNGSIVTNKIINVGNLTGQNFGEDAQKYEHNLYIFDTIDKSYTKIENPYALNFYSLTYEEYKKVNLKSNSILSIKVKEKDLLECKEKLDADANVKIYKLIVERKTIISEDIVKTELININHLDKFKDFVLEKLGTSSLVTDELGEVMA